MDAQESRRNMDPDPVVSDSESSESDQDVEGITRTLVCVYVFATYTYPFTRMSFDPQGDDSDEARPTTWNRTCTCHMVHGVNEGLWEINNLTLV